MQVDIRGPRFEAPASPAWLGPYAVVLGWLAGGLIVTERVPNEDRMRLAESGGALVLSVVGPVIILGLLTVLLLLNRPRLTLDSDAITMQGFWKRTSIGWDRLMPGAPMTPGKGNATSLALYETATSPTANLVPHTLPTGRLHVDAVFLANTIRYYVDQPGHRPAIGTAAELDRLRSALAFLAHPDGRAPEGPEPEGQH